MNVHDKIKLLPNSPGVYLFIDDSGIIIYIGKSKDLRKRVSQYFRLKAGHNIKTAIMVSKIKDLEHMVVNSESDALLLENNLIKEHQPKYNILLKDGKAYPWICIKNELFPRVFLTRQFKKDGSLYFGPYSSVVHAKNLLEMINSLYALRTCSLCMTNESITLGKYKLCLDYHIGKCRAPCEGLISEEEYQKQIASISEILKGNSSSLIKEYGRKMKECASILDFEKAQAYKQRKEILEKHYSKSLVVNASSNDLDVFSLVFDGSDAFGNFLRIKNGCIIQSMNLEMRTRIEEEASSVLSFFMAEIYNKIGGLKEGDFLPKEIYVPFYPEEQLFSKRLRIPIKGDKLALMELSRKNAAALRFEKLKHEEFVNPKVHSERILENLKKDLNMTVLPRHIECFDNSNTQGTNPVASCVVFKDAAASKKDYRHFNIKTVVGADDFASMKEVVSRRYSRLLEEEGDLPQLIIIDGGKGQVSFAYQALADLGLADKITLVGIAKRLEEIIVPGDPTPYFLDKNSTSLRLIMRMRDEAHRFGITHHKKRRSKSQLSSELDSIRGIGSASQEKLIKHFKTVSKIKLAEYSELSSVIGKRGANSLFTYLGKPYPKPID